MGPRPAARRGHGRVGVSGLVSDVDRSRVDDVLELRATARAHDTALVMRGGGFPLAMRRTGPHRVHVVGTGAWPLGGDRVALSVHVGAGARVELAAVAATIALPGRTTGRSRFDMQIHVEAGGTAVIDLGPTVVASAAEHVTSTSVRLEGDARLLLRELVVLGRTDEPPGRSHSRIDIICDARPVLREALVRPAGDATTAVDDARRAAVGIVLVGATPSSGSTDVEVAAAGPGADWLALPGGRGWRSIDLDDDVAALRARDEVRWHAALAALDHA
jgi:urease accessory protein